MFEYRIAQEIAEAIVGRGDVRRMFVRAFRLLQDHPSVMTNSGYRPDAADVFLSTEFGQAREAFVAAIQPLRIAAATVQGRDPELSESAAEDVRQLLLAGLRQATSKQAFETVVAFLSAVDRSCGLALADLFYARLQNSAGECTLLPPDTAMPRPPAAFGSAVRGVGAVGDPKRQEPAQGGVIMVSALAPPSGVNDRYFRLERFHLDHLVAPLHRVAAPAHAPALHPSSAPWRVARREWRVAMLSILADLEEIAWDYDRDKTIFWGTNLSPCVSEECLPGGCPPPARCASRVLARLDALLDTCRRQRVNLVILPELNADNEIHQRLEAFAREGAWIIAGALHEPAGWPGTFRNRPRVYSPGGELSWPYAKSAAVEFRFEALNATMLEALANENPPVVAIDTEMGRVAVLVCKDFLEGAIRQTLEWLRATVVVVVSMTPIKSVEDFRKLRDFAGSNAAVSLFCNSSVHYRVKRGSVTGTDGWTPRWELGLAYTNTKNSPGKHAWHPLPDPPEPEAVLGLYTISATAKGTTVQVRGEVWPLPEGQGADAASAAG